MPGLFVIKDIHFKKANMKLTTRVKKNKKKKKFADLKY